MISSVVYVVADKLGGIASLNSNLIRYRLQSGSPQCVIRLHDKHDPAARIKDDFGADSESIFEYSRCENAYSIFRRLRRTIPSDEGALISNNWQELALYSVHPTQRTIFQIVHDEFNFRLAKTYQPIVDVMIAHSRHYYDKLVREFPQRLNSIFHLPYGIRLGPVTRSPKPGALRLVFLGRLHVGKGVHDLPCIDQLVQEAGVDVRWTVIGDGPERKRLQEEWPPTVRVRYANPPTNQEVLALCAEGDVFVLPTRFEGFPVALLEAMSAGLVPVVTDLPSGVPEVVVDGAGFRPRMEDCEGFASAIIDLSRNRGRLESMSVAARKQAERFDVREKVVAYHQLFGRWRDFKRSWPGPLPIKHGSRLDQPWLPNWFVRAVRSALTGSILHCA
jgi:glycosyltransferase involved in cell wall biosynthesis